ncbi:MAG: hypothetical protein IOMNBAOH_02025 [Rhodocyclaceae bacterium]|nr:hypothetical protein [Rhodocyclaceae bacterium]
MHLHTLPIDEALARLNTTAEGLSEAEAARRLASFGANAVEAPPREPLWRGAARQVTHFFALILWLAAALAFVAEHYQPGQGMATLGAAILGVIVINGAFSFWQEYRAERALDALQRLLPHAVRVQRAGVVRLAPARELVPGDVILLEAGAAMAAYFFVLHAGGWQYGQTLAPTDPLYRAATGACLAAIVLMQVANVWLCRSARGALFAGNGRPSPLLFWGIGFELLLLAAILYTPWGNQLFGTAPLAMDAWWFMLPFPLAMLALEEARKALVRRWRPAEQPAGGS